MDEGLSAGLPLFERACYEALVAAAAPASNGEGAQEGTLAVVAAAPEDVLPAVASLAYKKAFGLYSGLFAGLETQLMKDRAKEEVQSHYATVSGPSLTYGEIDFHSFADILERLEMREGDTLVDLGSGTGRALVTAALLFGPSLARVHGIELLASLHSPCEQVLVKLRALLEAEPAFFAEHLRCKVTSERGDITDTDATAMDWTVADVVFINSTLFDAKLMTTLCAMASARMRSGTRVITLTRPWLSPQWQVSEPRQYRMSWGVASAFVHVKL